MKTKGQVAYIDEQEIYVLLQRDDATCWGHTQTEELDEKGLPKKNRFQVACCKGGSMPAFKVRNPLKLSLQKGDLVEIRTHNGLILFQSFLLLILPIIFMVLGYHFSEPLFGANTQKEQVLWGLFLSFLSFILGFLLTRGKKQKTLPSISQKLKETNPLTLEP